MQAVGRAIRLAPDKTVGTIVIPAFIDTDEDPEIALDDSAFKPVWDVIKALRSHDDELGEHLDELRRQLGRQRQRPRLPGKIIFDLPARVGIDFSRAFDVRLVEQTTASWEFWFGLLERFVECHGHACVPSSDTVDGYPLGRWVTRQRVNYAEHILDAERQRRLEDVPGWTWDPFADKWEEGFRRLAGYVKNNHDARVPQRYEVDGFQLGNWVSQQRANHVKGTLDASRECRLEDLPHWSWEPKAAMWEEGFCRLLDYVKYAGNARVPVSYTVDGYPLGTWVGVQRNRRRTLDAERQRRLEDVPGWTWDPHADQWDRRFSQLQDYVEHTGHARVPYSYTVDGYRLGGWVNVQRNNYAKGTLEVDRQRRLRQLPGWTWDPVVDQWEEGFNQLLDYVERHGDARVPYSHAVDGYGLGRWVSLQRVNHAKGMLDASRERRLEDMAGWTWGPRANKWEEGFSRLLHYVERHGRARVPQSYTVDGHGLGRWVAKQRARHGKGILEADRQHRLLQLPGWTWDPHADQWEEGFNQLLHYVERHGDARVLVSYTVDGYPLGRWVVKQRVNHAKGTLDPERQHRLQDLPGWTWKASSST